LDRSYLSKLGVKTFSQLLIAPVGLLTVPLYTTYLSKEEYGLYGMFFTLINFIQPFVGLGLGTAFSKNYYKIDSLQHKQASYYSVFYFRLLTGLLLIPFVFLLRNWLIANFFLENIEIFYALLVCLVILPIEPIQNRFFRSSGRVNLLSILLVLEAYLYLALAYLVLTHLGSITSLIIVLAIARILRIFLVQLYISKIIGFALSWDNSLLASFIKFGVITVPFSIGIWIIDLSDRFFIGSYLDMANLGFYQVANSLVFIPKFISGILGVILFEQYSKLMQKNRESAARKVISDSANILFHCFIWITILLLFEGRAVLSFISSDDYAEAAFLPMLILVTGTFVFGIFGIMAQVLVYSGQKKELLGIWNLGFVVNLIFNMIFITRYGIIVCAISTLLAYILALKSLVSSLKSRKLYIPRLIYKFDSADLILLIIMLLIYSMNFTLIIFVMLNFIIGIMLLLKLRKIIA
jgi:O-antigen/teichoic acid export membrane protein